MERQDIRKKRSTFFTRPPCARDIIQYSRTSGLANPKRSSVSSPFASPSLAVEKKKIREREREAIIRLGFVNKIAGAGMEEEGRGAVRH